MGGKIYIVVKRMVLAVTRLVPAHPYAGASKTGLDVWIRYFSIG